MDGGERIALPENISEAELVEIVRELIGDDEMPDEELLEAFRSGMFQELCPDIEEYRNEREKTKKSKLAKADKCEAVKPKVKEEPRTSSAADERNIAKPKAGLEPNKLKIKEEPPEAERGKAKHNNNMEMINKPKVKTERRSSSDEERGRSRDKIEAKKVVSKPKYSSASDQSRDRSRKKEKKKIKIKKVFISSTSRSSSSSRSPTPERKKEHSHSKHNAEKSHDKKDYNRVRKHKNSSASGSSLGKPPKKKKRSKSISKRIPSSSSDASRGRTPERKTEAPTHSKFNGAISESSRDALKKESTMQSQSNNAGGESTREKPEVKKEMKPFSKYSSSFSNINIKTWKPSLHREHLRYQRKYKLKPVSVVCVDMQDVPLIFHNPRDPNPHKNSVPLKPHVTVSSTRMEMFKRLERDKASAFKKKLNRKASKFMKKYKLEKRHGEANHRRAKIMDRIVSSTSDSDTSSIMIPSRKVGKLINDNHKGRGGKMTKADKDAEARRRKIEEVKKKAEKFSARGTRVLPWENKNEYFKGNKKKEEAAKKEKERVIAEKRRKQEQLKKERLEKQKNAPSVSFQKILAVIDAANKAAATAPKVELRIPKLSRTQPPREYKPDGMISIGDVSNEVTRLLGSDVKVECPVIPDGTGDFGEYTVRKIAWWFLKNEKTPAEQGLYHPECRDNEGLESDHDDDFDWPSDMSSIHGCVSDPEGVGGELGPDPTKVNDADWADDYCGAASLYAKMRKVREVGGDERLETITLEESESVDGFKTFFRVKPGTNYEKPNFEAKCFICDCRVTGQRQLGAHIRSDSHKQCFRNYSLKLASYNEDTCIPAPKKEFVAKLIEYSVNATENTHPEKSDMAEEMKHQVAKIERVRSDSPGPIIDGGANGGVEIAEMPIPDNISLPSVQDYDISSDESLMNVKVAIRTEGKWNNDLEKNWRAWQAEETKIAEKYNELREYYINEPTRHKNYQEEWMSFWNRRSNELEAEGVDTDQYNFEKEWLPYWLTRVQEIMKEEVEDDVKKLKRRYGIDKDTLRARFRISAEATKRKNMKKKFRKTKNLSSSVNSRKKSTITEGEVSQTQLSQIQRRENEREEREFLERKHQREMELQGGSVQRDKELQERRNRREREMQERKRQREAKERETNFELGIIEPTGNERVEAGKLDQLATLELGRKHVPETIDQQLRGDLDKKCQLERRNESEKIDQLQKDSRRDKRERSDSKDYQKDRKGYHETHHERKNHHRDRDRHKDTKDTYYRDKYHNGRKDHKDRKDHHHRDRKDHHHHDRKSHKERTDHNREKSNQPERRNSSYEQGNSRDSGSNQPQLPQPIVAPVSKYVYSSIIDETTAISEESVCLPTPPGTSDVVTTQETSRSNSCGSGKKTENHVDLSNSGIELAVSIPVIPEAEGLDDISPTNSVDIKNCDSKNNGVSKIIDMENVSSIGSSLESGEVASEVGVDTVDTNTQRITSNMPRQPPAPPVISERRPSTNMDPAFRIQTYISR